MLWYPATTMLYAKVKFMKKLEKNITEIQTACLKELKHAATLDALEAIRVAYLGRKGKVTELMGELKTFSIEEKRTLGPLLNALKQTLHQAYELRYSELEATLRGRTSLFDVTAYKPNQPQGSVHLYTQIFDQLAAIFISMGYTLVDGPEVETDYYNFAALNIPAHHPARDSHDTFWLGQPDRLLRTHTSPVQVRAMEQTQAPLAIFAPGRVYRNEATDATHGFMFTQGELLLLTRMFLWPTYSQRHKPSYKHFLNQKN